MQALQNSYIQYGTGMAMVNRAEKYGLSKAVGTWWQKGEGGMK